MLCGWSALSPAMRSASEFVQWSAPGVRADMRQIYPIGIDEIIEHASPYRRHLERLVRPYVQAPQVPEDTVR